MLAIYKEDKYKLDCPSFKYYIENGLSTPYTGDLEIIKLFFDGKKKRTCLDIGSHIGTHSIPFSRIFERVFSFEPNDSNYEFLLDNIKLNNRKNISPFNVPILDGKKNIQVVRHSTDNSGCFTTKDSEEGKESNSIDNLNLEDIDFIKIDVEGREYEVLKGGEKTIIKYKPLIQIEMNYLSKNDHGVINNFFKNIDYQIYKTINNDVFFRYLKNKKIKVVRRIGNNNIYIRNN